MPQKICGVHRGSRRRSNGFTGIYFIQLQEAGVILGEHHYSQWLDYDHRKTTLSMSVTDTTLRQVIIKLGRNPRKLIQI